MRDLTALHYPTPPTPNERQSPPPQTSSTPSEPAGSTPRSGPAKKPSNSPAPPTAPGPATSTTPTSPASAPSATPASDEPLSRSRVSPQLRGTCPRSAGSRPSPRSCTWVVTSLALSSLAHRHRAQRLIDAHLRIYSTTCTGQGRNGMRTSFTGGGPQRVHRSCSVPAALPGRHGVGDAPILVECVALRFMPRRPHDAVAGVAQQVRRTSDAQAGWKTCLERENDTGPSPQRDTKNTRERH
jgi:hypothetical protein